MWTLRRLSSGKVDVIEFVLKISWMHNKFSQFPEKSEEIIQNFRLANFVQKLGLIVAFFFLYRTSDYHFPVDFLSFHKTDINRWKVEIEKFGTILTFINTLR